MTDPVSAIRSDSLSGATELLLRGARVLREHAENSRARSRRSFIAGLGKVGALVADAQPAMAPFIHLSDAALRAAEEAEDLPGARAAVVRALGAFVKRASEERERLAEAGARLVRQGSVVLVYSRSSTVEAALLQAAREGRRFSVLCPESRPNMEGRILARRLAGAGVQVTAFVDAAAFSLFPSADLILVGADAVVPVGLINKVGTSGLALLAQGAGVPLYCLAGTLKMLPSADLIDPNREGEHLGDVWGERPAGVRLMDRYYDLTQLDAVTAFVSEDGLRKPAELRARLQAIRLHPAIRRTDRGRRGVRGRARR